MVPRTPHSVRRRIAPRASCRRSEMLLGHSTVRSPQAAGACDRAASAGARVSSVTIASPLAAAGSPTISFRHRRSLHRFDGLTLRDAVCSSADPSRTLARNSSPRSSASHARGSIAQCARRRAPGPTGVRNVICELPKHSSPSRTSPLIPSSGLQCTAGRVACEPSPSGPGAIALREIRWTRKSLHISRQGCECLPPKQPRHCGVESPQRMGRDQQHPASS